MKKTLFSVFLFSTLIIFSFTLFSVVSMAAEEIAIADDSGQSAVFSVKPVKSNPGTSFIRIGEVNTPDLLVVGYSGLSCQIEYNGKIGWINCGTEKQYEKQVSRGTYLARKSRAEKTGTMAVEAARNYLGKPYVYGAAGPDAFDCSGLLYFIFGGLGIDVPRSSYEYTDMGTEVSLEDAVAGDVICFSQNGSRVSHVAIYMGNGEFIHSACSVGVTITPVTDPYWEPRIQSVRRILE